MLNYGAPVAYCITVHNSAQLIPAKIPRIDRIDEVDVELALDHRTGLAGKTTTHARNTRSVALQAVLAPTIESILRLHALRFWAESVVLLEVEQFS
jgi:hypothetical protein